MRKVKIIEELNEIKGQHLILVERVQTVSYTHLTLPTNREV